jgi:hypothetical protein
MVERPSSQEFWRCLEVDVMEIFAMTLIGRVQLIGFDSVKTFTSANAT